jgi:hypothetical protein
MSPSLLLALLEGIDLKSAYHPAGSNISEVISSIEEKRPSLIKDIAREKLYDILYETIENESPDSVLNMAIGRALTSAINGETTSLANDNRIQVLRDTLRNKLIEGLTPQQPPSA